MIKDTYNTKMDWLTNASLFQDSIKFVEQIKEKIGSADSSGRIDKKEKDRQNGIQGSTEEFKYRTI